MTPFLHSLYVACNFHHWSRFQGVAASQAQDLVLPIVRCSHLVRHFLAEVTLHDGVLGDYWG